MQRHYTQLDVWCYINFETRCVIVTSSVLPTKWALPTYFVTISLLHVSLLYVANIVCVYIHIKCAFGWSIEEVINIQECMEWKTLQ
jgi:hypothetical protein